MNDNNMKFTILGFNQKRLIELGIGLDEALILRYFVDFKDSQKMIKEYMDGDMYYWIEYESLIKSIPILNISKDRVYRKLKRLAEMGILKHKTKKNGGTFSFYSLGDKYCELIMYMEDDTVKIPEGTVKIPEGYGENNGQGTVKIPEGYGKNNGTKYSSIKDTSIKDTSIKDTSIKNIVDYLNTKAKTNYKYSSSKTRDLITARFNDGFKVDNFKAVIDKKVNEWAGTDMEKYLRPETLFGTKFESYLNQKTTIKSNKDNFNNYNQRDYDYDSLEKKLLGWDKPEGNGPNV